MSPKAAADHHVPVAILVGPAAAPLRRSLGPLPWCALECLIANATLDEAGPVVDASVRSLAADLGVAKNTAHRGLTALIAAGVASAERRRRSDGTFGPGRYRLHVDEEVLSVDSGSRRRATRPTVKPTRAGQPSGNHTSGRPSRGRTPASERGDQLSLLPSA